MFTVNLLGNIRNIETRKGVNLLARALIQEGEALLNALHAIDGGTGAIEILAVSPIDGIALDGLSEKKINDAAAEQIAAAQAEMDAIHARQAADLEARVAAEQAAAMAFEAKINELVETKLSELGVIPKAK